MRDEVAPVRKMHRSRFEIDSCMPQLAAMQNGKISLHALTKGHYPGIALKPSQLPGIASVGFMDGNRAQDWGTELHRNEGVEVAFMENGATAFIVEGRKFDLRSGHFTITRPWELHKLGGPNIGPGRFHWLILDVGARRPSQAWNWPPWLNLIPDDRKELTRRLRKNENPVWNSSPEIASVFRGISGCILSWPRPHVESQMLSLLNQLFLAILKTLGQQPGEQDGELASRRRAVDLFLRDLADTPGKASQLWTLNTLATECGMGKSTFAKYCREFIEWEYWPHGVLEPMPAGPGSPATEGESAPLHHEGCLGERIQLQPVFCDLLPAPFQDDGERLSGAKEGAGRAIISLPSQREGGENDKDE